MTDNSQNSNMTNNIDRARSCRFREENLCGKAKSCKRCSYMKNVSKLWKEFCDTQLYKSGSIAEEWNNFPIGTFSSDIVDWFYNTFEVDIDALKLITKRETNIDLTSKSRILPDGRKFPKTPEPQIIKENFGSIEVVNSDKRKQWRGR